MSATPVPSTKVPSGRMRWGSLLPIERVVTILTPLIFAPVAALIAGHIARVGLVHVDPTAIIAIEGTAFVSAVGIAAKWLHGRQIPALIQAEKVTDVVATELTKLGLTPAMEQRVLELIGGEVEKAVSSLHIPVAESLVQQVVDALTQRLGSTVVAPAGAAPASGSAPVA